VSGIRPEVLRAYSRLLRLVLDEVSDAILVFDPNGEVILSNRSLENLLGVRTDTSGNGTLREALESVGAVVDAETLSLLLAPDPAKLRLELRDGGTLECRVTPLWLEMPGDHRLMTFGGAAVGGLDLHELRHRAFHDSLTGLPNRDLLLDRLEQALARRAREGGAIGVVFVDLDGFKLINDRHGHAAGDQVLVEVAERLAQEIRPMDTVGRLGGDEFVIVCGGLADTHAIELVCRRIQRALDEPFVINGNSLEVGASMGAVVEWNSEAPADALLARADEQMYKAKRFGTHIEVARRSTPEIDDRRAGQIRALQGALGDGNFELLYLPLVSLGLDRVVGVEALLRSTHAELRRLDPPELVHLAEDAGLIGRLNAWVLNQAADAARALRLETGAEISVHINLSGAQLADPGLGSQIMAAAAEARIDRRMLGFDLAENLITVSSDSLRGQIDMLVDLGCQLFVDDVTSTAAIEAFGGLPIDAIKIDGAVIESAADAPHMAEELRRLVALAHERRLSVVAEGIVDERTLRLAREIGCNGAQGYGFFGFPRPVGQLTQLIG
jgi:diguanylate cyclase (GGDEF)-like protein